MSCAAASWPPTGWSSSGWLRSSAPSRAVSSPMHSGSPARSSSPRSSWPRTASGRSCADRNSGSCARVRSDMYRTCLFCSSDLGHNEVVEHFPIGRRLAFDAAKGRLWVVCRKCERWNLTPLEERWEAIEECERAFRGTRLRVSTDQIGLARLREGLELVRIGDPQRPEMAAWRYGDQFGRRRRRKYLIAGGVVVAAATVVVAGPALGIVGAGAISPVTNLITSGSNLYRANKKIIVPAPGGRILRTRLADVDRVKIELLDDELALRVPVVPARMVHWRWGWHRETVTLTGEDAVRAAGALLPQLNWSGGSAEQVQRAVGIVEEAGSPAALFSRAARDQRE